jgi:hypothetical protein
VTRYAAVVVVATAIAVHVTRMPAVAQADAARRLIDAITSVPRPTGVRLRAALTTERPGRAPDIRQISVRGRRTAQQLAIVYEQTWPTVAGGRAVLIRDDGDHRLSGATFDGGRVVPLRSTDLERPVLDSDLTLEDVLAPFWFWHDRRVTGEESVGADECTVIELRPGRGVASSYGMVTVWLSRERTAWVRARAFDKGGRAIRQIGFFRFLKTRDHWAPGITVSERTDGTARTVLEVSSADYGVDMPATELTVDAIRRSLRNRF